MHDIDMAYEVNLQYLEVIILSKTKQCEAPIVFNNDPLHRMNKRD